MNLRKALDWFENGVPMKDGTPPNKRMDWIVAAARAVAEGADTPDYEAAVDVADTDPYELGIDVYTHAIVDAAVKGRRLVEWEDTDG